MLCEIANVSPTKLIPVDSPSQRRSGSACCTIGGYGGGLLGGDKIELEVGVGAGSTLVLNTQGSTKVEYLTLNSCSRVRAHTDHYVHTEPSGDRLHQVYKAKKDKECAEQSLHARLQNDSLLVSV